jgi:curved DNA-binding protein
MATKPRDYYEVLGVGRDASAEQIRKAYRRLAREHHPDVSKAPDAATRFSEVQEAYEVLSDAAKRKAYDRFGHAGVGVGQGPGGGTYRTWGPGDFGAGGVGGRVSPEDFSSIFEGLFGGRSPFGAGGGATSTRQRRAAERGENVREPLSITFMTAALGGHEQIRLTTSEGATQTIDVRIPPGVQTGEKLRVRGKGAPGMDGGEPGDLILEIEVGGHPWFRRDGLDLLLDVPISFTEAVKGTTVTVPLLQGTADIKVPPGASSGRKLRVPARGIANAKGMRGDFYAVLQVAAPRELSERGRKLVEELAPELPNPRASAPWADELKSRRS